MSGSIFPSFTTVNPSYTMPELILQYSQASGAFALLANSDPDVRLGEGDLYVYAKTIGIKTKTSAGTHATNVLPGVSINAQQISTPTYLIQTQANYNHHDVAAASNWGVSLPEALRLGQRQGTFQQLRNAELYGFNPTLGEGLVNTPGATAVNLPADTNGHTTLTQYDAGQLGVFLLTQIGALKSRMMQIGMPARITICMPQRVSVILEYTGIVQLTQFQREGAGSATIALLVDDVTKRMSDTIDWVCDDTLIGKGAGGTDLIIINAPEIKKPVGTPNTNEFAKLSPGLESTCLMLCDMAAPREIVSPLPQGGTNVITELRTTSGWCFRPEAITLMSAAYS